MSGRSRNVLDKLAYLIVQYDEREKEIAKANASDYLQTVYYKQEFREATKDFEKEIRSLIQEHITFLQAKDPFGRVQTHDQKQLTEKKIQIFKDLLVHLNTSTKETFRSKLEASLNQLKNNALIDRPRWPTLTFANIYQLLRKASQSFFPQTTDNTKKIGATDSVATRGRKKAEQEPGSPNTKRH